VSKTVPSARVRAAVAAGLGVLGENRVQEAAAKISEVPGASWHLVGPLQGNKARRAVELARTLRSSAGLKVRQPLARMWLALPGGRLDEEEALLALVADHPERPELIGIAGYPEGHPLISDDELERALRAKSRLADYVVTQMCFDTGTLRGWIERERDQGMELPVVIGMPGKVTRRKLLRMATRIGVGPSLDFLRKQRGLRALLSRRSTADRLFEGVVPLLDDPLLAVAGFQYFTFNELLQTWEWHQRKASMGLPAHRGAVCPEMTG